jgi:branched-chain amino acid transport system permease protein
MLLFLIAGGLTIIFGLMRVINLSHGAFYLLGAYIGVSAQAWTGSFWVALVVAPLAVGGLALAVDRLLRRRLYGEPLNQVLVTLGLAFVISDAILWRWGGRPRSLPPPEFLSGSVDLGLTTFPAYRLAIIVVGVVFAVALAVVWRFTRVGALLRAGVDDSEMLEAMGVRVSRLFTATFVAGSAIAAMAGVLGGPFLGVSIGLDFEVLLYGLVIVVIGGLGSLPGAFVGSLLVGLVDSISKAYVPELSFLAVFGPVVLVLALRPGGLFTRSAV